VIACGVVALAGAFALGFTAFDDPAEAPASAAAPTFHHGPIYGFGTMPVPEPSPRPPLALEQVRIALAQAYYRHVSPLVLAEPTISRILTRLDDEYTEYLSPVEFESFQGMLDQRYYGIGLTLDLEENGLIVTRSLAGPARAAGIRPGDVIVSIDGKVARDLGFDRSLALFDGAEGTTIRVTVQRPGHPKALDFELVRGPVEVSPVRARLMKSGGKLIGYIRLLTFADDAAERVGLATRRLVEAGAHGLILDLRGDPGGYLTQAIAVSSLYLDHGVVCYTSGVNQETRSYSVSGAAVETERPLAVLVDGATASAAEIVAGALRDNDRAIVVGQRTFGKAAVQSLIALSDGGALKLTTATYLTPSGASIAERGLKPSVKAVDKPLSRTDEAVVAATRVVVEQLAPQELPKPRPLGASA
jgi:carboxyl-terminal processing protease